MKRDPSCITFLNLEWVPTAKNNNLQEETEGSRGFEGRVSHLNLNLIALLWLANWH